MVTNLFIKQQHNSAMVAVQAINLIKNMGIQGNVPCSPYRELLINTQAALDKFNLVAGSLWENIIIDNEVLYTHSSGTILKVGSSLIRLTFHCEPCFKIKDMVKPSHILHQRGYLAQIIDGGVISIGDTLTVLPISENPIPYDPVERIKWFISQQCQPVYAIHLIRAIGLAPSYCRALPAIIKKHKEIDSSMILFKNKGS